MPISLEEAYETLADEERFRALIDRFAERLDARTYAGGWAANDSVEQIVAFKGFEPEQVQRYLAEYAHRDPWTKAFMRTGIFGRFVNMLDYVELEEFAQSELYTDFFVPEDLDVFYAVPFMMLTDGIQSGLTFHRGRKHGEFDRNAIAEVNEDAPDLARLFHLKVRTSQLLHRADDWQYLVSRMEVELYLIDRTGKLIDCNGAARAMLDEKLGLAVEAGRLRSPDTETRRSLRRILSAAAEDRLEATDSFTVNSERGKRRLIVLPLRRANGSFRLALIGESKKQLDSDLEQTLRAAFGLSPVEATIMIRLANGEVPKEISLSREVSQETTRTQYRSAIRKMDCRTLTDAIIAVRRLPTVRSCSDYDAS